MADSLTTLVNRILASGLVPTHLGMPAPRSSTGSFVTRMILDCTGTSTEFRFTNMLPSVTAVWIVRAIFPRNNPRFAAVADWVNLHSEQLARWGSASVFVDGQGHRTDILTRIDPVLNIPAVYTHPIKLSWKPMKPLTDFTIRLTSGPTEVEFLLDTDPWNLELMFVHDMEDVTMEV